MPSPAASNRPNRTGTGRRANVAEANAPASSSETKEPSIGADDEFVLRAEINDPDGYTNVRASKAASSEIVAVVRVNEEFRTFDQTGSWWKVKTSSGEIGYMHVTRIRIRQVTSTAAEQYYGRFPFASTRLLLSRPLNS